MPWTPLFPLWPETRSNSTAPYRTEDSKLSRNRNMSRHAYGLYLPISSPLPSPHPSLSSLHTSPPHSPPHLPSPLSTPPPSLHPSPPLTDAPTKATLLSASCRLLTASRLPPPIDRVPSRELLMARVAANTASNTSLSCRDWSCGGSASMPKGSSYIGQDQSTVEQGY